MEMEAEMGAGGGGSSVAYLVAMTVDLTTHPRDPTGDGFRCGETSQASIEKAGPTPSAINGNGHNSPPPRARDVPFCRRKRT